jgi:hypothetical protein
MATYLVSVHIRWGGAFKRLEAFVRIDADSADEANRKALEHEALSELTGKKVIEVEIGEVSEEDRVSPEVAERLHG